LQARQTYAGFKKARRLGRLELAEDDLVLPKKGPSIDRYFNDISRLSSLKNASQANLGTRISLYLFVLWISLDRDDYNEIWRSAVAHVIVALSASSSSKDQKDTSLTRFTDNLKSIATPPFIQHIFEKDRSFVSSLCSVSLTYISELLIDRINSLTIALDCTELIIRASISGKAPLRKHIARAIAHNFFGRTYNCYHPRSDASNKTKRQQGLEQRGMIIEERTAYKYIDDLTFRDFIRFSLKQTDVYSLLTTNQLENLASFFQTDEMINRIVSAIRIYTHVAQDNNISNQFLSIRPEFKLRPIDKSFLFSVEENKNWHRINDPQRK
jgi:hypothetical protein